jgi:hypothetical protein
VIKLFFLIEYLPQIFLLAIVHLFIFVTALVTARAVNTLEENTSAPLEMLAEVAASANDGKCKCFTTNNKMTMYMSFDNK